jgi:hypothetical protein
MLLRGQGTFINLNFLMVDSSDNITPVTSLTFANSGDVQILKLGSDLSDIAGDGAVTERGAGWYQWVSSVTSHSDTLGHGALHFPANGDAIPTDVPIDFIVNDISSMQTDIASFDQYKADLSPLTSGLAAGTVQVPTASVTDNDPLTVFNQTNLDATFYLNANFSSYISSEFPAWLVVRQRDTSDSALMTVEGISTTNSVTAIFSASRTDTNVAPGVPYVYQVQFRDTDANSANVVKVALTGTTTFKETY